MNVFNKNLYEIIVLISIIYAALFLGAGNTLDHIIEHDRPYGYLASDAFWHEIYAEGIKETGSYKTYVPYIEGGFDDVVANNPPVLPHLAVMFSFVTGLNLFDAEILLVYLIAIVALLVFFMIIRRTNSFLAILSIPLALLLFKDKFSTVYTWGIWTYLSSTMFIISFAWSIDRLDMKKISLLMGLFLTGTIIGYFSNFIYSVGFIIFYFAIIFLLTHKLQISKLKEVGKGIIYAMLFSSYYLYIFYFTLYKTFGQLRGIIKASEFTGYRIPLITDLKWMGIIILVGFLSYLVFTKKKLRIVYLFPIFMFIASFANYIGFEKRALTVRYFWPVYLSVFFGLVFFMLINFIKIKQKTLIAVGISLGLIVSLSFYDYNNYSGSIMDPYHWEAFKWIGSNVNEGEEMLYFYSYALEQTAILMYGRTIPYIIRIKDLSPFIEAWAVPRNITMKIVKEAVAYIPYKKGPFSFGYHGKETPKEFWNPNRDICSFDYILIDKVQNEKVTQDYNQMVIGKLMESGNELVFNNPFSVIIKIQDKGDCV